MDVDSNTSASLYFCRTFSLAYVEKIAASRRTQLPFEDPIHQTLKHGMPSRLRSPTSHLREGTRFRKAPHLPNNHRAQRTQKVRQRRHLLLGGQYAILCQFAHPGLALGTTAHSNFASRLLNRLQTTARFLNAAVYGTQAAKEAIFSVIHQRHSTVKGPGYDADDAELHKWTAATLFMSLIVVHETFFWEIKQRETGSSISRICSLWDEFTDAARHVAEVLR